MYDVVALGELLVDFTPCGVSAQELPVYQANPGGAPCNVLSMLSRLGRRTAFIGKVGRDGFGDFLRQTLLDSGIDVSGLAVDEKVPTTLAFVQLDANGDRSFTFYRSPGADIMLRESEVDTALLDDCAMCGRADPVEPVFDAAQGVVLCKTCAGPAGGLPLDAGALAAMRHIVGAPSKRLLSFTLEPASLARLSVACETFAAAQFDRRFRTLDFYKSIRST